MGDAYESVTVDTDGHVAQVTLVGPGKGNAMGPAFWSEMPEVFAKLDADREVRAIVLTGSGKNFSYGPRRARDGRVTGGRADRRVLGTATGGLSCRDPADAESDQRRRRLPDPDHRIGARLVHRRRRRPDLGRRHPLCQCRREVLGAGGSWRWSPTWAASRGCR